MIVYDLSCDEDHRFEGWFADRAAFLDQNARNLVACPVCSSTMVEQAVSAARISGVRNNVAAGPAELLRKVAALQAEMLPRSKWVGGAFAKEARAMAEGETPSATIHGQATPEEARALRDDGIAVMPLLVPVVPPEQQN